MATPSSSLVDLLSSSSEHPSLNIVDSILVNLDILDFYSLHATCRSLSWILGYMTESRKLLSIDRCLKHYIKNPTGFRAQMAKSDALIADDFANIYFVFKEPRPTDEMRLYIQEGPKVESFAKYMMAEEGYRCQNSNPRRGLTGNLLMRRGNSPNVVRVTATRNAPLVAVINTADTSSKASFISWNKAYSLIPIPLVVSKNAYPVKWYELATAAQDRSLGFGAYETLGYLLRSVEGIPLMECRRVGDSKTLIIPLGNDPEVEHTPDYVIESSVFSTLLERTPPKHIRMPLSISAEPMRSRTLKYVHTNGSIGLAYKSWQMFLEDRLEDWVYKEIFKLKPEERPSLFQYMEAECGRYRVPEKWQYPESWTYADDQVATWFKEWESKGNNIMNVTHVRWVQSGSK